MNPLERLPAELQRRLLVGSALAFFGLTIGLSVLSVPLVNDVAPWGIVSFELARTGPRAAEILSSWGDGGRTLAMIALGVDFLYLVVYPTLLSLACLRVADRHRSARPGWARVGTLTATAVLAAAPLDGIENFALWRLLVEGPVDAWARLAWATATLKFALVVAAGGYVLTGLGEGRDESTM